MNKTDKVYTRMGKAVTDWRFLGFVFVIAVCIALGVAISAADDARDATTTANKAIETNRAKTEVDVRKARIVSHGTCLRLDDSRRRIRTFIAESVRLSNETSLDPAPEFTPNQRIILDRLGETIATAGDKVLPPIDCDVEVPLPRNITDAEKAILPELEPIEGGT